MMLNEFRRYVVLSWMSLVLCACSTNMPTQLTAKAHIFQQQEQLSRFEIDINNALLAIEATHYNEAEALFKKYPLNAASNEQLLLLSYTKSRLELTKKNVNAAKLTAFNTQLDTLILQSQKNQQEALRQLRVSIAEQGSNSLLTAKAKIHYAPFITNEKATQKNSESIWALLNSVAFHTIQSEYQQSADLDEKAWYALVLNQSKNTVDEKILGLEQLKNTSPQHSSGLIINKLLTQLHIINAKQNQIIAVILPFEGKYAAFAQAVLDGLLNTYYQSSFQPQLRLYSAEEPNEFIAVYQQAIKEGANIIIGPLLKPQLETLYQYTELPIPTIALNKIDKSNKPKKLLEFTLSTEDEIKLLVDAAENRQLNNAFVIYQNDDNSNKNMNTFVKKWQALGHTIIGSLAINQPSEITEKLEDPLNISNSKQRIEGVQQSSLDKEVTASAKGRNDIDGFFVFANFDSAKETNTLVNSYYPTIYRFATSTIYRGYADYNADQSINQFIFADIPMLGDTGHAIPKTYQNSSLIRLFALGKDAFTINTNYGEDITFAGATGDISISNMTSTRTPKLYQVTNNLAAPISVIPDND